MSGRCRTWRTVHACQEYVKQFALTRVVLRTKCCKVWPECASHHAQQLASTSCSDLRTAPGTGKHMDNGYSLEVGLDNAQFLA